MSTPLSTETEKNSLIITMLISSWEMQNKRLAELITKLSDEELLSETSPGKNTGVYLLGHIIAASDGMFTIMGLQDKMYPALEDIFLRTPDKSGKTFPAIDTLKEYFHTVTNSLNTYFKKMSVVEWLSKHNSVSAEDFAKEPHRNKLNILISRTNHLASHLGQMLYLEKK